MKKNNNNDKAQYIKINLNNLNKDMNNVLEIYNKDCTVKRNYLTSLFNSDKYLIGVNPLTNKNVFVMNKDLSYFICKHGKQISKEDILSINNILDYWKVFKNIKGKCENGYIFIRKSKTNDGYLEGVVKNVGDEEELFHYQYIGLKTFKKKYKKICMYELTK